MLALGVATCIWLPLEWCNASVPKKSLIAARLVVFAIWSVALGLEMSYQIPPTLPALGRPTLFVIGDSVSAGMSDADKETWPKCLRGSMTSTCAILEDGRHRRIGTQASRANRRLRRAVLLEIGGNDLLGSTTADQFEERLDQTAARCLPGGSPGRDGRAAAAPPWPIGLG